MVLEFAKIYLQCYSEEKEDIKEFSEYIKINS
jgi:hypothetical protein